MKFKHLILYGCFLLILMPINLSAQSLSHGMFCYGSTAKIVEPGNVHSDQISFVLGQPLIGETYETTELNRTHTAVYGIWSFFQLPPLGPYTNASDGDFPNRVEVRYPFDPLSAPPNVGFKVFRDSSLIAILEANQVVYQDYNVTPGQFYFYEVLGINQYNEGGRRGDTGFVNPNGILTGIVTTSNNSPVPGVDVTLTPLVGNSLLFDGDDMVRVDVSPDSILGGNSNFTLEAWIKTNSAATQGIASWNQNCELVIDNNEIEFHFGNETFAMLSNEIVDEWHHIALSYDGAELLFYWDGYLQNSSTGQTGIVAKMSTFTIGKSLNNNYFSGQMDEVRIWSVAQSVEDIRKYMNRSLSDTEPDLAANWTFNEGVGTNLFDLTANSHDGVLSGPTWVNNGAEVYYVGTTDNQGNYQINGINYGTSGRTFTATPEKIVPINSYSLELDGVDDHAMVNHDERLNPASFTIELWANRLNSNDGVLLSKSNLTTEGYFIRYNNDLEFGLGNGETLQTLSGSAWNLAEWHHIAVVFDSNTDSLRLFEDGNLVDRAANVSAVFSANNLRLGASPSGNFFTGRIDEVRIWSVARSQEDIISSKDQKLSGSENGLVGYWPCNEGPPNLYFLDYCDSIDESMPGTLINADSLAVWSNNTPVSDIVEHEFSPESRVVTLSPSNTALNFIDFTDLTQIPVNGIVKYANTSCGVYNVEILVDGASYAPPIYTDENGFFIVEFEPGTSHRLTPVLENHSYSPQYLTVNNISTPVAGLVFNDLTTRTLDVYVYGGNSDCRHSLTQGPLGDDDIVVTIGTPDGCFERSETILIGTSTTFNYIPPLEYVIVTVDHEGLAGIGQAFSSQVISLAGSDQVVDFVYQAPLTVTISGLPDTLDYCVDDPSMDHYVGPQGEDIPILPILEQNTELSIDVSVIEDYSHFYDESGINQTCPIDTGFVTIYNDISDAEEIVLPFRNGQLNNFKFKAGIPNILSGGDNPYQKSIQAAAVELVENAPGQFDENRQALSPTQWVYVEGDKPRENGEFITATTQGEIMWILRDPPGDGSYSYVIQDTTLTTSVEYYFYDTVSHTWRRMRNLAPHISFSFSHKLGENWEFSIGADLEIIGGQETEYSVTYETKSTTETSLSLTFSQSFATSGEEMDEELLKDGDGDVFIGLGQNFTISETDHLSFDGCELDLGLSATVTNIEASTLYFYSRFYINNYLIPGLEEISQSESVTVADSLKYAQMAANWRSVIQTDSTLVADADSLLSSISFDGGTGAYQYSATTTKEKVIINDFYMEYNQDHENFGGAFLAGFGFEQHRNWVSKTGSSTYFDIVTRDETVSADSSDCDGWRTWRFLNEEGDPAPFFGEDNPHINATNDNICLSRGFAETDTSNTSSTAYTTTWGYYLNDDEPGDYYWVNVYHDGVYGPVFKTEGGASSCPWESNTAKRESVQLSVDNNAAVSVPYNEPAVFNIDLSNLSETGETMTYELVFKHESNPDGALVKINGLPVTNPLYFMIAGNQTLEAVMTVERGPQAWDYEDLTLRLQSTCEARRAATLGIEPQIYEDIKVDVSFVGPCSEVFISNLEDLWEANSADGDTLSINLAGYDTTSTDLDYILLEYREIPPAAYFALGEPEISDPSTVPGLTIDNPIRESYVLPHLTAKNDVIPKTNNLSDSSRVLMDFKSRPIDDVGRQTDHDLSSVPFEVFQELLPGNSPPSLVTSTKDLKDVIPVSGEGIPPHRLADDPSKFEEIEPDLKTGSITTGSEREGWIIISQIAKVDLGEFYTEVEWITGPLLDGFYQLKATVVCSGDMWDYESDPISGILERYPPQVVGTPEPADGVLNSGDNIRVSFSESISCNSIIYATSEDLNNIGLYNTTTDQLIAADVTCYENTIYIEPTVANEHIENQVLRVQMAGIKDLYDNAMAEIIQWEFFVDRNPVAWSGGHVETEKFNDEPLTLTRQLTNSGATAKTFTLTGLPTWLAANPLSGQVYPNVPLTITFTLSADMIGGAYVDTVYADTNMGDEPLIFAVDVVCHPPDWAVDPTDYQYSMTVTGYLEAGEELPPMEDIKIGAFIGGQIRGVGSLQLVTETDPDSWLTFLTVHSNQQTGESVTIRIWDELGCTELGQQVNAFSFVANQNLGTLDAPFLLDYNSLIVTQMEMNDGWNWFSLNMNLPDMSLNAALSTMPSTAGDLIKSQTTYSQYVQYDLPDYPDSSYAGWVGSLDMLDTKSTYMVRLSNPGEITLMGQSLGDLSDDTIMVRSWWNWISYQPNDCLTVSDALASLHDSINNGSPVNNGSLIKNQTAFALYYPNTQSWVGSLLLMEPNLGYMLYLADTDDEPDTLYLTYPNPAITSLLAAADDLKGGAPDKSDDPSSTLTLPEDWTVNPALYEHNMTLTGLIISPFEGGQGDDVSYQAVAAFVEDECRGVATPVTVPGLEGDLFFLMVYGQFAGEMVEYRALTTNDEIVSLTEITPFEPNASLGNVTEPFVWTFEVTAIEEPDTEAIPTEFSLSQNYPNPFNPTTTINFALPVDSDVEITVYNAIGQRVKTLVNSHLSLGYHSVVWNSDNDDGQRIKSGVYFYRMKTDSGFDSTRKLLLLK